MKEKIIGEAQGHQVYTTVCNNGVLEIVNRLKHLTKEMEQSSYGSVHNLAVPEIVQRLIGRIK